MLQAEWKFEHRLADARAYRLIEAWVKDCPPPGELFPYLAGSETDDGDLELDPDADDEMIAQQVFATLGAK